MLCISTFALFCGAQHTVMQPLPAGAKLAKPHINSQTLFRWQNLIDDNF